MSPAIRQPLALAAGLLALLLVLPGHTQAYEGHESELWTELGLRHRLNKKVALGWRGYWRFNGMADSTKKAMTQLGLRYRVSKHFQVVAGYRHIQKALDDGGFETSHRGYSDFVTKKSWKPFALSYRLRLQREYEPAEGESEDRIRNKVTFKWSANKRLRPLISSDLFVTREDDGWTATSVRNSVGFEVPIKGHEFALLYRHDYPLDDGGDPLQHMVSFAYGYEW